MPFLIYFFFKSILKALLEQLEDEEQPEQPEHPEPQDFLVSLL